MAGGVDGACEKTQGEGGIKIKCAFGAGFGVQRFNVQRFRVQRFRVQRFRVQRFRVQRFRVQRFRVQRLKRRTLNIGGWRDCFTFVRNDIYE